MLTPYSNLSSLRIESGDLLPMVSSPPFSGLEDLKDGHRIILIDLLCLQELAQFLHNAFILNPQKIADIIQPVFVEVVGVIRSKRWCPAASKPLKGVYGLAPLLNGPRCPPRLR